MRVSKPEQEQPPVSVVQYLTFFTAGEEYAVNIGKVKEIVKYEAVTTVPNTPAWIRGVTNLRGTVVPVVDLAAAPVPPAFGSAELLPEHAAARPLPRRRAAPERSENGPSRRTKGPAYSSPA